MKPLTAFLILCSLIQVSFGQHFKPHLPDTNRLKALEKEQAYTASLGYLYLSEYYQANSERDSIHYYEWGTDAICAFQQSFENGITYKIWDCQEEGGGNEQLIFPLMDSSTVQTFIELLFYDEWNTWVSEFAYEPEGAGCYYTIQQTEDQTIIDIYCGC